LEIKDFEQRIENCRGPCLFDREAAISLFEQIEIGTQEELDVTPLFIELARIVQGGCRPVAEYIKEGGLAEKELMIFVGGRLFALHKQGIFMPEKSITL
jgi:hypothetical protein